MKIRKRFFFYGRFKFPFLEKKKTKNKGLSNEGCKDVSQKIYQETKKIQDFHNIMNQLVTWSLQGQMDQEVRQRNMDSDFE